jgi:hypothetical protein
MRVSMIREWRVGAKEKKLSDSNDCKSDESILVNAELELSLK